MYYEEYDDEMMIKESRNGAHGVEGDERTRLGRLRRMVEVKELIH
jgi:hypothetical protein